jgi:uncharacterized membrane protein SpoIIM required for sporulation
MTLVRQATFEARYRADWLRFEAWLDRDEKPRKRAAKTDAKDALPDRELPQAYRRICQHLALARDRQYSPELVDHLNQLALRGHTLLYGARTRRGAAQALAFFLGDFPRLVRAERRLVFVAALFFFGPLLGLIAALQWYPDFVHYLHGPDTLAKLREMYDPANQRLGMRPADDNVAMFGFYIWNNVKIGFQTFATGLAFGLGSLFYLVFNGVVIGAVAGYLTQAGYGAPFWSFVAGHGAFELVAIVISGAAGLRLGLALVAPGQQSRKAALVNAARPALCLMVGAAAMFLAAAFIEAFWSPLTVFPPLTKYTIGAALWGFVIGYFVFQGRPRAA